MAQAGFTPISLYFSSTAAAVPTSGNLANGELALNIADMKLYAKNSAGTVTLLASSGGAAGTVSSVAVSGGTTGLTTSGGPITTSGTITLAGTLATTNGGTGLTSFTSGGVVYASSSSALATGSALTWDGSLFTVTHASGVDGRGIRLVNSSNSQTWETRIGVQALENTSYAIKDITAGAVRLLINISGYVGIGTNSPNTKLHIAEASDVAFTLSNSSSVTSGNRGSISMANSSNSTVGLIRFGAVTDNVGTEIQFYTRPVAGSLTQAMTLDASGLLLLGHATSQGTNTRLQVSGAAEFYGSQGANGVLTSLSFWNTNSSGFQIATIQANTGGTIYEGQLLFYTKDVGGTLGERFRIASSGQLGIGGANYGTAGQVLTSGGSGAAPTWAAAGGGSQAFVAFGSTGGL